MTSYFLGIDIGGTKSHALIADETGRALGFGRAGPGNYQSVGYPGMEAALRAAAEQALASAGLHRDQIAGAGFGIGGYDWPSQEGIMRETIGRALGLRASLTLVNDAVLGLLAGTEAGWGVALVAGTGNNCRGRDREGREGRVTGEGWQFGEYGGAGELVMRAVQVVSAAWSRRGPPTALTAAFVAALGARDGDDLLEGLSLERYHLRGDTARLVFQVAAAGDPVAVEVIAWAGRALGDLAVGVIRQLDLEHQPCDVVLVGSMFNGGPLLLDPLRATIEATAPQARLRRLAAPPVIGAVLLGLEHAGLPLVAPRAALVHTTTSLAPPD